MAKYGIEPLLMTRRQANGMLAVEARTSCKIG
jgi:hypothetical protein